MAVYFYTTDAKGLLAKFDSAIRQKEAKGKITTWEPSDDGKYYTHKAADWNKKAWFRPHVDAKFLRFNIIKPKSSKVGKLTYAYYHGHLIETILNHFDDNFTSGSATAQQDTDDLCS